MFSFAKFGNDLYSGKKSFAFIRHRKIWYIAAIIVIILSIIVPVVRGGFNLSIEFKGGSSFQISDVKDTNTELGANAIKEIDSSLLATVSKIGNSGIQVQTAQLSDVQIPLAVAALAKVYGVDEKEITVSYIGPTWGEDVTRQALVALIIFLLLVGIIMFLYFRTWRMSVAALSALFHDLVVTVGIYAATGFEVSPATVIGFLTILGYSLYDTIVVFDKIRENVSEITLQTKRNFSQLVNLSLNQTLVRSINTSVVAILPVASILFIGAFLLGAGTLRDISLALFIGMLVGTYSTIFLATPIYFDLSRKEKKFLEHDKKVINTSTS